MSIAKQFSRYPAGRVEADGPYNGEKFRRQLLVPALKKVGREGRLVVDFDGLAGAGSSFLEEAFGGLVREEGYEKSYLDAYLELRATEPGLQDLVYMGKRHIERAAAGEQ